MTADKVRLFIGVRTSMATLRNLEEVAAELRQRAQASGVAVRWVEPANYHVTLQFLGWARAAAIAAVRDQVGVALEGAGAFSVSVQGLGAFPRVEKARVLWAGVSDPRGRLADLAGRVARATEPLGFVPESRAFHPHVTLGRLRDPANAATVVEGLAARDFGRTRVAEVKLFESVLKPSGSSYLVRSRWPLGEADRGGRQTSGVEEDDQPTESEHLDEQGDPKQTRGPKHRL